MNKKIALPFFLLVSHVSLAVFAEDAVDEVVVTGTTSNNTSTNSTPTQNEPMSKAGGYTMGTGYADAKAQEAAAAEKGARLNACYQQLALLASSKFACSDDGELIDVVEVVGAKDNDVSQGYAEQDAVRPEPILDPALRPTPQMCYTLSQDLFNCEQRAFGNFTRNSSQCSYAQMMETGGSLIAGIPLVGDIAQSIAAAVAVGGAYLLGDCGNESAQTTQDKALSACRYEDRQNTETCAIYN